MRKDGIFGSVEIPDNTEQWKSSGPCPSCAAKDAELTRLREENEQYKAAAEDDLVMRGQLRQQLYDATAQLSDHRKAVEWALTQPIPTDCRDKDMVFQWALFHTELRRRAGREGRGRC